MRFKSLVRPIELVVMLFSFHCSLHADDIVIYVRDDVYSHYVNFVDGREVTDISTFSGSTIRRDVVDMIIVQQALSLGGFNYGFSYVPGKINFRNTNMLQQGKLLLSFDSYWLADANSISEHVYISEPVIRKGEYFAGIYTSPKNEKTLNIKNLDDFRSLTAVSTPRWKTDWQTLSDLPLKELIREDEWLSMARMVKLQWIDFLLMPFHSSEDQSFTLENIHLVPVKNVAVQLNDSRHFVVSKRHPLGESAIVAINQGLKQLRAKKAIVQAYQEAGFFRDTSALHIINPPNF